MGDADINDEAIRALYQRVLEGWNNASAEDFSAVFAEDGEVVGFDGSQNSGRARIAEEMARIFADHPTGTYVGKVLSVRPLGSRAALLKAVAGMIPAGQSDLNPKLNAVQWLAAEQGDGQWRVVLYQNTPAQFHGRQDLADSLTQELRQVLQARADLGLQER